VVIVELKIEELLQKCGNQECPLLPVVSELLKQIAELKAEVKELKSKLNSDSSNSSQPPSLDGFKRNNKKSLREKTDKKQGGQKGHTGHSLKMTDTPDEVICHKPAKCSCGHELKDAEVVKTERRQVINFKVIKVTTEHRADTVECPCCKKTQAGTFPEGVEKNVQYGETVKALSVYLTQQQHMPYERTAEFFSEVIGLDVSPAVIVNYTNAAYLLLQQHESKVVELLEKSKVIHKDETGAFNEGKLSWIHVTSTEELTYYNFNVKRGADGIDEGKILEKFDGTIIHDFWKSYFKFNKAKHGLCNAHLIRELKGIYDSNNSALWSQELLNLLVEMNKAVTMAKELKMSFLEEKQKENLISKYKRLVEEGLTASPESQCSDKKRGRKKQSKAYNLLRRLRDYESDILRFMEDFDVPFTNNQAERDIRMVKVKQKISGTFRSLQGAKAFCRIRGYISTVKKHGCLPFIELMNVFLKKSFIPV
jgi:transposase